MYTCNRKEQPMDCDCQLPGSKVGGENEKFMGRRDLSPVWKCSQGLSGGHMQKVENVQGDGVGDICRG